MASGVTYHSYFTFKNTLPDFKKDSPAIFLKTCWKVGCFDLYWSKVDTDAKYLIVGWEAVPLYFPEIVESFNNTFKNSRVTLLWRRPVFYTFHEVRVHSRGEEKPNALSVIIAIELSPEYSETTKKFIWYLIHNLFRMTSLCEEAYEKQKLKYSFVEKNTERDFCTLVSKVNEYWNSQNYTYRGMEFVFKPEHVRLIDDVTLCNGSIPKLKLNVVKQTRILFNLLFNSTLFTSKKQEWNENAQKVWNNKPCLAISAPNFYEGTVIGFLTGPKTSPPSPMEEELTYWVHPEFNSTTQVLFKYSGGIVIVPAYNVFLLEERNVIVRSENIYSTCIYCGKQTDFLTTNLFCGICFKCAKRSKESATPPVTFTMLRCKKHFGLSGKNCDCTDKEAITKYDWGKEKMELYNISKIIYK